MKYRRVPGTDIDLSELSLGTGDNAGLFVWGNFDDLTKSVARAFEEGINHFDTSPEYGRGRAEANLGSVLRALKPRNAYVTTKVEIFDEHKQNVAKRVVQTVEDSLIRLGLDAVHFVQIHNPPGTLYAEAMGPRRRWATLEMDDYLGPNGALEGLVRLQKAGKVLHIGLSCEFADNRLTRQLLETGLLRWINIRYNLTNPTAGVDGLNALQVDQRYDGIISAARANRVGTGIIRPLAGGTLSDASVASEFGVRHPLAGGDFSTNPAFREMMRAEVARARNFRFLAEETGDTLAVAAYRFILMHEGVTSIITGVSDDRQLDEALEAVKKGPLDSALLKKFLPLWQSNLGTPAAQK